MPFNKETIFSLLGFNFFFIFAEIMFHKTKFLLRKSKSPAGAKLLKLAIDI